MTAVRPRAALNAQLFRLNEGYRSAGIARYIHHLLRELPTAAPEFDLHAYSTEAGASRLLPGVTIHTTRLPVHKPLARLIWEQTIFAWRLLRENFALVHSLAYVAPLLVRTPIVVTLYDLSFLRYPGYFPAAQRLYLQLGTRMTVRRARRIIAISESTRADAIALLGVEPDRVAVVPPGVEPEFFERAGPAALESFRRRHQLPDPFILFLGTREPRKNIPTLLRAFATAKRVARLPHRLVIAGGRGWMDEPVGQTVAELGLEGEVSWPGFVPHDELPLWYQAADIFVYPSQYEGFGMPALEALASGTPVITTDVSSLPEAVGDAGLLVPPGDTAQLADALVLIAEDANVRNLLRQRGPEHACRFTWARAAELTASTYRAALARPPAVGALATAH